MYRKYGIYIYIYIPLQKPADEANRAEGMAGKSYTYARARTKPRQQHMCRNDIYIYIHTVLHPRESRLVKYIYIYAPKLTRGREKKAER